MEELFEVHLEDEDRPEADKELSFKIFDYLINHGYSEYQIDLNLVDLVKEMKPKYNGIIDFTELKDIAAPILGEPGVYEDPLYCVYADDRLLSKEEVIFATGLKNTLWSLSNYEPAEEGEVNRVIASALSMYRKTQMSNSKIVKRYISNMVNKLLSY